MSGRMWNGHFVEDAEFARIQELLDSEPDPRDSSDAAQERAKVVNKAEDIVPTEDKELEELAEARAAGFPSREAQEEVAAIVEDTPTSEPNPATSESNAKVTAKTEVGKASTEAKNTGDKRTKADASDKAAKAATFKEPEA